MTISTQTNKTIALGNGATTVFNYNFFLDDAAHMYVVYTDAAGNESVVTSGQYTLTGVDSPTGGTLTLLFVAPIPLGTKLTMMRVLPFTQPLDIVNQDGFYAQVVEDGFDNLEMQIQQVNGNIGLSLRLDVSETNWDFKGHRGINLASPINVNDAVNKTYVDAQIQAYLVNGGPTTLVNQTFDTVAAAQASSPPLIVNAITTLGYTTRGVGGARYLRVAAPPSHPGYITTTGGTVYWELDKNQVVPFEAYGLVGDGITDDTAAVKAIGTTINVWKQGRFKAPSGKTSKLWPDDASATANPTLWNLTAVKGLEVDCSGWAYTTGFTGNLATTFCLMNACSYIEVRDYKATHAGHTPTIGVTLYGVSHWSAQNGSHHIKILDVDIVGGVNGLNASRNANTADLECEWLTWTGVFDKVGYPINCQASGNHVRFDIKCQRQFRAFIFYGVHDLQGSIDSKNYLIDDIVIAAYYTDIPNAVNMTRDAHIRYRSHGNNIGPMGGLAVTSHQNYTGLSTAAGGTRIENIHIEVDCEYDGLNAPNYLIYTQCWNAANTVPGPPTVGIHYDVGIRMTGVIAGNGIYYGGGGANFSLCEIGGGYTAGTFEGSFVIGPLDCPGGLGGPSRIGQGTWIHFDRVRAAQMVPAFAGTVNWGRISMIGTIMSGYGLTTGMAETVIPLLRFQSAPTSGAEDGDIWFDGTDLKMRVAGVTKTFTLV